MSNEITRENVQAFLDLNAASLKEAAMDNQERQLRHTINNNHTTRTMTDIQRQHLKELAQKQRQEERVAARRERQARELEADKAVRYYGVACLVILLLSAVTKLPLWAGATLALGLAAVFAAYIYRIFVPWEVRK